MNHSMTKAAKKALKPFDEIYLRMWTDVQDAVANLSAADFLALQNAVREPTETNCGWSVYRVNQYVKDAIHTRKKLL